MIILMMIYARSRAYAERDYYGHAAACSSADDASMPRYAMPRRLITPLITADGADCFADGPALAFHDDDDTLLLYFDGSISARQYDDRRTITLYFPSRRLRAARYAVRARAFYDIEEKRFIGISPPPMLPMEADVKEMLTCVAQQVFLLRLAGTISSYRLLNASLFPFG